MGRIDIEKQKILEMMNKISPIEINESTISPDKLIIKSIMKEYGIPSQKYDHSSVRGFKPPIGKGYSYGDGWLANNGNRYGTVQFHKVSPETIEEIANKLREHGFNIGNVVGSSIGYSIPSH